MNRSGKPGAAPHAGFSLAELDRKQLVNPSNVA
jgi:hypothetical protein